MNSGASADAINFYNKSLKVYSLQKTDKESTSFLKNTYSKLGYAYHSRGQTNEALAVFDEVLDLYGYKVPRNKIKLFAGFMMNMIYFIIAVKYDKFFFNKTASEERSQLLDVIFNRAQTISTLSPKRFLIETIYFARLLIPVDLSRNPKAFSFFIGYSIFFFWTGISLKISSRIFKISDRFLGEKDTHAYQEYKYLQKMHNYHCGILETDDDLDLLFDTCMQKGFFWEASYIMFFNGFCHGDKGNREMCRKITDKLINVADQFENQQLRSMYYRFVAYTSYRYREFDQKSQDIMEEGLYQLRKTQHHAPLSTIYSRLSSINTLLGNVSLAGEYLEEAAKHVIKLKTGKPFYGPYLMAKSYYEFELYKSGKTNSHKQRKTLQHTVKELIKTAWKFRGILPEALVLKAKVQHYLGNNRACSKTFKEAQKFAETSGAKVELSRIYFELGKFLTDPGVKFNKLNGISGKEYLEKAKNMFEEMDLQWDWVEYRKYESS
jgi:tetratricopeptide (TPR) repeat protein